MFFEPRRLALALSLLPGVAWAAPSSRAAAETLFTEGRAAMERGDYAKACPLLARSQELDPAGGTLLNLALCHEREGRLVAALSEWRLAAERAHGDGRNDREREALIHVADLESRIPHVSFVTAVDPPSGLGVSVDGAPISPPTVSVPTALRLDPGTHSLRSELAGRNPVTRSFELQERRPATVAIEVPGDPALPAAAVPAVDEAPLPMAATPAPRPAEPHARFSLPSKILLGASAAAGITALVTGIVAVSSHASYSGACVDDRSYCTDKDAIASGDRARTMAWVSTGAAGVGFVALWTALLLPRNVVLTPAASTRGAAFSLQVTY